MNLVSIMMPCYNVAPYIAQAIDSCIAQTHTNFELIIVDDGSTDGTYAIAQSYAAKDSRIKLAQQKHQGCPQARNACLAMMSPQSTLVFRQDADDSQFPTRLAEFVRYFASNPKVDIVSCDASIINTAGVFQHDVTGRKMDALGYMAGSLGAGPMAVTTVCRKSVSDALGNFDTKMPVGSDADWNFRSLIKDYEWDLLPDILYLYRRREGQLTQQPNKLHLHNREKARRKYMAKWVEVAVRYHMKPSYAKQKQWEEPLPSAE